MRRTVIGCLLALSAAVTALGAIAAQEGRRQKSDWEIFGRTPFVFRGLRFPGSDSGRVEVEVALVNDVLQFTREPEGGYSGGYELTLSVLNEHEDQIAGRTLRRRLRPVDFAATNSRSITHRELLQFDLPAGHYRMHLDIMDLVTRKHLRRDREVQLPALAEGELHLSDVIYWQELPGDSTAGKRSFGAPFYGNPVNPGLSYEISGATATDSLQLVYTLSDWMGRPLKKWRRRIAGGPQPRRMDVLLRQQISGGGRYRLHIFCRQKKATAEAEAAFFLPPQGISSPLSEISEDDLLGALKYIASSEDYRRIQEADSSGRVRLLQVFWAARDPSPETSKNELQEEFQRRVAFANRHFSVSWSQKKGWQTDRGKIYIVYGAPDWVRRPTREFGAVPVEIWYYRQIDRRFVFRDESETGDYRLIYKE